MPTTLSSGGSASAPVISTRNLSFDLDHSGSVTGAQSIWPSSSAATIGPKPPVLTSSASSGLSPAFCSIRMSSAWLVERGLV